MIQEFAVLPVEFDGNVRAAIEVGHDTAAMADDEGGLVATVPANSEAYASTGVDEIVRTANQVFVLSHAANSATLSSRAIGDRASRAAPECAP